ncbi:hypothetical protein C4B68_10700 [Streptomyces dengpaensis]|uniref:Uncharacterized protein n=1 Tax=Streptomyces dengpaensis TaxID=2049881 RepID=A0ABN5HYE4_9ACTN|nr:hypothetical protein C4B68_10700 [Streptomyces dengpaensis]
MTRRLGARMELIDKLTGTQHPEASVAPLPAHEVWPALLRLNRPDAQTKRWDVAWGVARCSAQHTVSLRAPRAR